MFVLSKRNIILPSPDGSVSVRLARDGMCAIPDWAAETAYFKALVADGKIVPAGMIDSETQAAAEKPVRVRRGKEVTAE